VAPYTKRVLDALDQLVADWSPSRLHRFVLIVALVSLLRSEYETG
jgi:hypothetical protein